MKRIKYRDSTEYENHTESARSFFTLDGDAFKVFLNEKDRTYKIKNLGNNEIHYGGRTGRLDVLKRQVKRKLIELGVKFEIEIRQV